MNMCTISISFFDGASNSSFVTTLLPLIACVTTTTIQVDNIIVLDVILVILLLLLHSFYFQYESCMWLTKLLSSNTFLTFSYNSSLYGAINIMVFMSSTLLIIL